MRNGYSDLKNLFVGLLESEIKFLKLPILKAA